MIEAIASLRKRAAYLDWLVAESIGTFGTTTKSSSEPADNSCNFSSRDSCFFFSWEDGNETWFLNRGEGNDSNLKIYGIYGIMESFLKNRNFRNLLFFLERKREILWEIKKFDLRNVTNFSSNLDICDILIIRIVIFLDCNRN